MNNNKIQTKKKKSPLYVDVYEQIKEIIQEENLAPGDRLPSENELVARLGVSRGTVRQALILLREGGDVYEYHRKGHFVAQKSKIAAGLENAAIGLQHFSLTNIEKRVLNIDFLPSTKSLREIYLEDKEAALIAKFHFQYFSENSIIAYEYIFVPYKRLEAADVELDDTDALTGFVDNLMQNARTSVETTIDCVEIRDEIIEKMGAANGSYVYSISEISRDKTGSVIAYSTFYCYPEYFKFKLKRTINT